MMARTSGFTLLVDGGVKLHSVYFVRVIYDSYLHQWGFRNENASHQTKINVHIQADEKGYPITLCPVCNNYGCRRPDHLDERCRRCVQAGDILHRDATIASSSSNCELCALLDESRCRMVQVQNAWFAHMKEDVYELQVRMHPPASAR